MYHDFGTEIKLLQFIDGIISKLPDPSKAKKLAETMKDERKNYVERVKVNTSQFHRVVIREVKV